jgi:hypothetical protein
MYAADYVWCKAFGGNAAKAKEVKECMMTYVEACENLDWYGDKTASEKLWLDAMMCCVIDTGLIGLLDEIIGAPIISNWKTFCDLMKKLKLDHLYPQCSSNIAPGSPSEYYSQRCKDISP